MKTNQRLSKRVPNFILKLILSDIFFPTDLYARTSYNQDEEDFYKVEKAPMMSLLPGNESIFFKTFHSSCNVPLR